MRNLKVGLRILCMLASFAAAPTAWAQWAVVDAPAIVQLIQEVQTAAQQLQTTKDQLLQAKQALQTMTGDRGMEQLLGGTLRNYLPSNWSQVTGVLQGSGGFSTLSAEVQSIVAARMPSCPRNAWRPCRRKRSNSFKVRVSGTLCNRRYRIRRCPMPAIGLRRFKL